MPRRQAALVLAGTATILVFMDIDNLMLVGAALWLAGAVPLARSRPERLSAEVATASLLPGTA